MPNYRTRWLIGDPPPNGGIDSGTLARSRMYSPSHITQEVTRTKSIHVVKEGEYLEKIAKRYGTSTSRLIALNSVLAKNPNLIYPGMSIRVSGKVSNLDDAHISRMLFDGRYLSIYSIKNERLIAKYPATSGLPPHSDALAKLIEEEGRTELVISNDYRLPKYQDTKDAGPIQEDTYKLILKKNMPYDKSASAGDGDGWGTGGWILNEDLLAKVGNIFGGRFGFFLHHDGGNPGTSGCIGVKSGEHLRIIRNILIRAQIQGQDSVVIEVKYP